MNELPSIVTDILTYWNNRLKKDVPSSLIRAEQCCVIHGELTFNVVCLNLLKWWRGGNILTGKKQMNYLSLRPDWTWCQILPEVLKVCPELATLIEIKNDRCSFKNEITKSSRTKIKEYIVNHMEKPIIRR